MAAIVSPSTRLLNSRLARKIMGADEAASLIKSGDQIGMSGFTGSGYPKAVPIELAHRIAEANVRGQNFQVSVFTGASTGPELDGALAMAGGIHLRLPYQSDPETRKRINAGEMDYMDIHLSHVARHLLRPGCATQSWTDSIGEARAEDWDSIFRNSGGENCGDRVDERSRPECRIQSAR